MKRRQGFTLVELLVAMALIIFMMAILSGAFQAALGTFRNLKAQGDLAEKLRATAQILQRDLAADHFDGNRRLSDPTFWNNGPPSQGFFRIWQGSPDISAANALEGLDLPNFIPSYRSTNHYLAFTVKLRGNDMGDFFSASAAGSGNGALSGIQTFGPPEARYQLTSGGSYNYQWAEVAWFLQPQINPTTGQPDMTAPDVGTPNGVPLFTLYRRQRLLVPDNNLVPPQLANTIQNFQEMSCWVNGGNIYFNSPEDITVPWRRFGMVAPGTTPSAPAGLLYATTGFPPSAWPLLVGQGGTWTLPSPTPPVPPTYPPSPTPPFLPPTPSYPTLSQQPGVPPGLYGADIQLNDVISFDVRVLAAEIKNPLIPVPTPIAPTFVSLLTPKNPLLPPNITTNPPIFLAYGSAAGLAHNPAYNMITGPMVFDTWTSMDNDLMGNKYGASWALPTLTGIPMWNSLTNSGPLIKAIQISIRIWDFKTNQTRQVTIVQAM